MKKIVMMILASMFYFPGCSQQVDETESFNSIQLEDLSEADETENEDDYNLQQLIYYKKHPLFLNGSSEDLRDFPLFDALLVENLLAYRKLLGDLISVYELQAVPGFTLELIKKIQSFVTVNDNAIRYTDLSERLRKGEHTSTFRPILITQPMHGFVTAEAAQRFTGDRVGLFLRYKYQFRQMLQYGLTLEKDAGEKIFSNSTPFFTDYQSAHFFVRNLGNIKALALGDYTVNLGQGLIHWQSQAFKKSSSVLNIKRQSEVLKPYQSAGEFNFFRGAAITFKHKSWEATGFASLRKVTANISADEQGRRVVTSFNVSGLHRTPPELEDKNSVQVLTTGGNIKWMTHRGHSGINVIMYRYSLPIEKRQEPYNIYSIKGSEWINTSFDFSRTFRNYHFFGEAAVDKGRNVAIVNGLIASLNQIVDVAVLYRKIDKRYQSVSGNAYTENSLPQNEQGIYTGLSVRPSHEWRLDFYGDVFTFPWMKYRSDAPSDGFQYLFQLNWKPSKRAEVYTRIRRKMKPLNFTDEPHVDYPLPAKTSNWRTHINYHLNKAVELRSRIEFTRYNHAASKPAGGYLFFSDFLYKPKHRRYSVNARIQYFEADSYDARIYAFENDLLYVSSTPAFYDNGLRTYVNFKTNIKPFRSGINTLAVSIKLATTIYSNKNQIGTGTSAIHGNSRSDVRFQVIYTPRG